MLAYVLARPRDAAASQGTKTARGAGLRGILVGVTEPNDTDPGVEAMILDGYRRMSPAQKLERVAALTRALDELVLADVRRRHPDANAREQALRVASRRLNADTMRRAFGWDPEREGY